MQGVAGGIGVRARSRSQSPDSSVNESQSQKGKEIKGDTRQGSEFSGSTDEAWGEVTRLAGLVEQNPNPPKKKTYR